MHPEGGSRPRIAQLCRQDLIKSGMAVDVKIVGSMMQVHRKDQAHQSEVMVTVQMADKDVADAVKVCLVFHQLHLSAFTTVDEEMEILNFYPLCRREATIGRQRAT